MKIAKDTRGQAFVLTVLFMVGLLGMSSLVLDVGSWFRASRSAQSTADAAALAGAQALPGDPSGASVAALTWANKNGGGVAGANIAVTSDLTTNDTITVRVKRTSPSFFAQIFGIGSANIDSHAAARADGMSEALYVAPIVVKSTHPMLAGSGCPCFNETTTIPLGKNGAPGAFDLLNLDGSRGGTSPGTLADWMLKGYNGYLGLGDYYSDPGAKFNSSQMQEALSQRINTDLLFPVYDTLSGEGANAEYHVIGWVGFHLTGFDARGSSGSITGYFTQVIWQGIQVSSGGSTPDFGAYTVQLVN